MAATNCVYKEFSEKPLAKHRPCTTVRRREGLHSLDVVRAIIQTRGVPTPSGRHTGSGVFFHSPHYANFSKSGSYLSMHSLLDVFAHLSEYHTPLKLATHFLALCIFLSDRMNDELGRIQEKALVA
jgi:hypothetical protein